LDQNVDAGMISSRHSQSVVVKLVFLSFSILLKLLHMSSRNKNALKFDACRPTKILRNVCTLCEVVHHFHRSSNHSIYGYNAVVKPDRRYKLQLTIFIRHVAAMLFITHCRIIP